MVARVVNRTAIAIAGALLLAAATCTDTSAGRRVGIRAPSWSPDGEWIAFARGVHPGSDVFLIRHDGTEEKRLSDDGRTSLGEAAWSPDGRRIVVMSGTWPVVDLYMIAVQDGRRSRLTSSESIDYMATWHPDGTLIAFASNRDVNMRVFTVSTRSAEVKAVTSGEWEDTAPEWSPDGKRIVFSSRRDRNYEIFVINADGSGEKQITDHPMSDLTPHWSPEGDRILFQRGANDEYDLYVMNADGSGVKRLTQLRLTESRVQWSPRGDEILFEYDDGIHVVAADGGGVERLTDDTGRHRDAVWSPDGARIAYVGEGADGPEIKVVIVREPAEMIATATPATGRPSEAAAQKPQPDSSVVEPAAQTETDQPDRGQSAAVEPEPPSGSEESAGVPVGEVGIVAAGEAAATSEEPPAAGEETVAAGPSKKVSPDNIRRAHFTTAVVEREPVDQIEKLTTTSDRVFFYTELVDLTGETVTHRWWYGGEVKADVTFEVRGPRWRVYSRKRLLPSWTGTWRVQVLDADGGVVLESTFEYEEATAGALR